MHSTYAPSPPPPNADAPQPPSLLSGLGQALRWLREKQTRKQYRVADDAGITKGMLSAYETGRQRPSLETLEKLLETLGCDLNDLHNALQLVNGRPERIKSWRGWQTTGWQPGNGSLVGMAHGGLAPAAFSGQPAGGAERPPTLGPHPATWPAAPSYSSFPRSHGAMAVTDVRESPVPPYGTDRPGAERSAGPGSTGTPHASAELARVLGLDRPRLAHEEEQALGQMLDGFHNLLRYWHRALAAVPGAAPVYPAAAQGEQELFFAGGPGHPGIPTDPGGPGGTGAPGGPGGTGAPGGPTVTGGSAGPTGSTGFADSTGTTGTTGPAGSTGSTGSTGSIGSKSAGAPGSTKPGGKR